jgi:hypothetical protein
VLDNVICNNNLKIKKELLGSQVLTGNTSTYVATEKIKDQFRSTSYAAQHLKPRG